MSRDPLELENRRRAYELVAAVPGLHLRDLARRLAVDVRTALYHLDHREEHGLVSGIEEGGFKRYFPRTANGRKAEIVDARDKAWLGALRRRVPLFVALWLLTRGRALQGELAGEAKVSPSTMAYHLARLAAVGMVGRDGTDYVLREPDRVARLLYAYRPPDDLIAGFLGLWQDFDL